MYLNNYYYYFTNVFDDRFIKSVKDLAKKQNIETVEYVFRSSYWTEIEPFIQDQTNLNKGSNPT